MKKKLMLKKEVIVQLEGLAMERLRGGNLTDNQDCITCGVRCPDTFDLCPSQNVLNCQTQAGSGGARAAASCGSCGQQTCNGQYSCVPYDCAPTNGGNSCNFPDGCALPSVGCAQ